MAIGSSYRSSGRSVANAVLVVASNAPAHMRVGGLGRYLCDGTDDQVEIQAAIDASGPGGVELSPGIFWLGNPGDTIIDGTCTLLYEGTPDVGVNCTALVTFDHGTMADVVVGQNYRLSGGNDGEGNSLEDNREQAISTVTLKTSTATVTTANWVVATKSLTETGAFANYVFAAGDQIYVNAGTDATKGWYTIASRQSADEIRLTTNVAAGNLSNNDIASAAALRFPAPLYEDYSVVDFDRIIGSIKLRGGVHLRGAGIKATHLGMAAQANCTAIVSEAVSAAVGLGAQMSDFEVYGYSSLQGDKVAANFDGRCNGVVLNSYSWDAHIQNVAVWFCKGDGVWLQSPWGTHWEGAWIEYNTGLGMAVGCGNDGRIRHTKLLDNSGKQNDGAVGPSLFLRYTANSEFTGLYVGPTADYCCACVRPQNNRFVGCNFGNVEIAAIGGLYLGGRNNVVEGSVFQSAAATTVGIYNVGDLAGARGAHTITGNTFVGTFSAEISTGGIWSNPWMFTVQGNHGVQQRRWCKYLNGTGASIPAGAVARGATGYNMTASGTQGGAVLGYAPSATADGSRGAVYERGPMTGLPVTGAVSAGNELTASATAGTWEAAGAADIVSAIADTNASGGTCNATLIDPYTKP